MVNGQQTIDSLQRELQRPGLIDTTRVKILVELSWEWAGIDPKIGVAYADSAELLAQQIDFETGRISALNRKGVNYWYAGQDSLAILAYEEVLSYHLQNDNLKGQGTTINNIALLLYNRADYSKALENHQQASLIFDELGLRKNHINSLSNEGVVFLALSDYANAMEVFLKALQLTEDGDDWERGNIYNNLGLVYKNLGVYQQAEKYYLDALLLYQKTGNQQSEANALGNLSTIKQLQGNLQDAEEYVKNALDINKKIGNPRRIASDYTALGNLLLAKGDAPLSVTFFDSARSLYERVGEKLNLSLVLLRMAKAGEHLNRPLAELYQLELQSLEAAKESGSLDALQDAWLALSTREERLGDFKRSLLSYQQYAIYQDSIFNQENEKKLLRAQIGYEYGQREKGLKREFDVERQLLEADKEKERLKAGILGFGLVGLALIAVLVVVLLRKQALVRQERLKAEFRARVAELELKALKAQMNPHFIFNALSSISNFLLKNQPEEADRYLTKFSRLIRRILEYSESREISLVEEIDLLKDYIALEALRLGKEVIFHVNNPDDQDLSTLMIPPLLLQPLVENSLWHGLSKNAKVGEISLGIFPQPDSIILSLKDNGGGEREAVRLTQKNSSMGMNLVKNRLEQLGEQRDLGPSWTLLWEKLTDGFEVKLKLAKPA